MLVEFAVCPTHRISVSLLQGNSSGCHSLLFGLKGYISEVLFCFAHTPDWESTQVRRGLTVCKDKVVLTRVTV